MIPEKEREALMRLTMCARDECGMCKYKDTCGSDFQYELATESMNILAEALRKLNNSEKPNNCDTCKWGEWYRKGYDITMMDDECGGCCSWNSKWTPKDEPQNHSGEATEMVKDKPQTEGFFREPTAEERKAVADYIDSISVPTGVNIFDLMDEPTISKMEQVEDEPMKTTDYCDICKRDMCEDCIADATNPYCVPSHYEINYEPKDEPHIVGKHADVVIIDETRLTAKCLNCANGSSYKCSKCDGEMYYKDTPQTDDAYFLELMGAVERGEISDAGANQAWYEYINHKDEPQTERSE